MGNCAAKSASSSIVPKLKARKMSIPKRLKTAVWDHHFGSNVGSAPCPCCKKTVIRQLEFHCGHRIPESKGGTLEVKNLIPLCAQCNLSMGTKQYDEFKSMLK